MSDDEHYYHATNHERASEIARTGNLKTHKPHEYTDQREWPDGSREKRSYFSANKHTTSAFHPEEGKPAVLRVHKSKGEFHREQYTGDVYSKKPIAAHHLEIEHEGSWHPLHKFFNKTENANSWDRFNDLQKQGFMRSAYASMDRKPPKAKKPEKPMVSCVGCMDWHREGKHNKDIATRKANIKKDGDHTKQWRSKNGFGEGFDEALEPHARRHAVLTRMGWTSHNLHHYTHPHLPGHVITSHPGSKEWTHHINNPINKKPERHGSGIWPGGHSFTGYLHSVHDRNPTAKAPEWRPFDEPDWVKRPHALATHRPHAESVNEDDRFLHRAHQQMHDLIQSLGFTREHPRWSNKEDIGNAPTAMTKSTYKHAQHECKAMILSHIAKPYVTVMVQPKDGETRKFRGTPESAHKFVKSAM